MTRLCFCFCLGVRHGLADNYSLAPLRARAPPGTSQTISQGGTIFMVPPVHLIDPTRGRPLSRIPTSPDYHDSGPLEHAYGGHNPGHLTTPFRPHYRMGLTASISVATGSEYHRDISASIPFPLLYEGGGNAVITFSEVRFGRSTQRSRRSPRSTPLLCQE